MKIYKFKDLTNEKIHHHFLDIVLKNSIWCAKPDSLNDEEEFKFKIDYEPSPRTVQLLSQVIAQNRAADYSYQPHVSASLAIENKKLEVIAAPLMEDIIQECRSIMGITSFSITKNDVYLWEVYGGKGNGVCVEINIPDHLVGQSYHRVRYRDKIFHVDSVLEAALSPDRVYETYRNILLTKTKKWKREEEIRFIGNQQDVNLIFDGHISEVTFGPNIPTNTIENLKGHIADHCRANKIIIAKL